MRKVFLSLAFVAIIVSSTMLPEVRQQTAANFAQLQKSRVGKNIFTAIQLELSSSNQENVVDRVLALLNELLNQTEQNLVNTQGELERETNDCDSQRRSYEDQIAGKQSQIDQGNQDLPNLQLEKSNDETNRQEQQDKHDQAVVDLNDANETNNKAVANHAKSTRNHNAMVEALQQARALVVTLSNSSFIQKSSSKILAQITAHTQSSLSTLESHPNKEIYSVLMQMAQEVAVQADQQLVGSVVEIIDDLLRAEADALQQESDAENQRQVDHNNRVQNLEEVVSVTEGEVLRLDNEIVNLGNQIDELVNNLENWNNQLVSLNEALNGHNNLCSQEISSLNHQIEELTSEVEVIRQVIGIFESHAIQDIKDVVENLNIE